MSKSIKTTTKSGGEKIDSNKAAAAQKLYWEVLVGKKKITADQLPESCSFNLYQLKAYLTEVEAEFNKLNVPYAERQVSVMPIAYGEKEKITIMLAPSVASGDGNLQHQFNKKSKATKAGKTLKVAATPTYNFQLSSFNGTTDLP